MMSVNQKVNSIKAIILDLDGTIIPHDNDYKKACVDSVIRCTWSPSIKIEGMFNKNNPERCTGILEEVYMEGLHGRIYDSQDLGLCKLFDKARRNMSLDYIKHDNDLIEALRALREDGVELYIMTNSDKRTALDSLERAGVMPFFEDGKVLQTHGKYMPETYTDFIKKHISHARPNEVMYFDDLGRNSYAAEKAGLLAFKVDNEEEPLASMLNDVIDFLESKRSSLEMHYD